METPRAQRRTTLFALAVAAIAAVAGGTWLGAAADPAAAPPPAAQVQVAVATPAPADPPNAEFRAIWVVATDLTSPEKVRRVVQRAADHNFNALIVQVRMRGDALYQSDFVPRSELLDGQPASFDPLALVLEEAHARSMEVHAWLNAFHTWSRTDRLPRSPQHVRNAHPDWFLQDASGRIHGTFPARGDGYYYEEGQYLNPAHPEVRAHLLQVYQEVARRYPVDGIHFDFIRFPARVGHNAAPAPYDPLTLDRFRAETGAEPEDHTALWDQWRVQQVTELVRGVSRSIRDLRPGIKVSAAVMAYADIALGRSFTDYRGWLREGLLDFVVPMDYTKDLDTADHNARVALRAGTPAHAYIGLGAYLNSPQALLEQIAAVRAAGAKGIVLFSNGSMDDHYLRQVAEAAFPTPAPRPHVPAPPPGPPPALPRAPEPTWLGRIQLYGNGQAAVSRLFYTHRGHAVLSIRGEGLTGLELRVNGRSVPVPAALYGEIDLQLYIDPARHRPTWLDNHTSKLEVTLHGPARAWAELTVQDQYERDGQ